MKRWEEECANSVEEANAQKEQVLVRVCVSDCMAVFSLSPTSPHTHTGKPTLLHLTISLLLSQKQALDRERALRQELERAKEAWASDVASAKKAASDDIATVYARAKGRE